MFRIDAPTAAPALPAPASPGAQGFFTAGNPATATPATVVTADWLNTVQEELRNVVVAGGQTLNKTNNAQLLAALNVLFAPLLSPAFSGAPTAPTPPVGNSTTRLATTEFVTLSQGWFTGDVKLTLASSAPSGWILMNDTSIGSAASGATGRANADTQALYVLIWSNVINAWAPVAGGRGVSALADFGANKPLTLPRALGRALAIAGTGSGLTGRALGAWLGSETHQLTAGEMPLHAHSGATGIAGNHVHSLFPYQLSNNAVANPLQSGAELSTVVNSGAPNTQPAGDHAHSFVTDQTGGGAAHNNMQPTMFLNAMIKL